MLRQKPTFENHLDRKRSCEDLVIKNIEKTLPRLNWYNNLENTYVRTERSKLTKMVQLLEVNNGMNRRKIYALQRSYVTRFFFKVWFG